MYKLNITDEDINITVDNIDKYIKYIEKLTNIKWKIIPDYEDYYIISEYGNVISIKSKKILNPSPDKYNYYTISLYKNSHKTFLLHRLVYRIFVDKDIKSKDKIYFKDGNRNNIHYSNLSLRFTLPKNLIDSKPILYNDNISKIPKPIEYEDLKKIVDKYRFSDITNFIENLQKDTRLEWRIIPDYNKHVISEHGNIINLKFRNILNPSLSNGYYITNLSKNNIKKDFGIHRLVYNAFVDKDIEDFDIHHKDENKINNHYSNLQKMTKSAHTKYHSDLKFEKNEEKIKEYLKLCEEIYNDKIKYNLINKDLAKKYNTTKSDIDRKISNIETFIYILDRDFNKFYNLFVKEKKELHKKNTKNKRSEYLKEHLEKAEKIYNSKYKDHLSIKELIKLYNMTETDINRRIKDIEIFTFTLDKNFEKFCELPYREKHNLRKEETIIKKEKNLKEYLTRCEKMYNDKIKYNLINKDLSKKYNIPEYMIKYNIKDHEVYLYLNKDFDKFYNLTTKEKEDLRKKMTENKRIKETKEYLKLYEEIYNKKYEENLSNVQLSKIYGVSESCIDHGIRNIKGFIFLLNRDFEKFYNLTEKEKIKLRKKIAIINDKNNNTLDLGKRIEDLKLSGVSNKDIAKKLNLSINRIPDIYKQYKKLINDKEIKDELKSIKTITN